MIRPAPTRQPSDTPQAYASILALWCVAHIPDHGAIATAALSAEQLELSARGLNHALTQRAMLAEVSTPTLVYDRIAAVLVFVRQRQEARAHAQAELIAQAIDVQPEQVDSRPLPPPSRSPIYPPIPPPKPITPQREKEEVYF